MSSENEKSVDVPSEEIKDESRDASPQPQESTSSEAQTPAEADKFMKFTKKATTGAEKVIGSGYSKVRNVLGKVNFDPLKSISLIDRIIDWAKKTFPPETFEALSDWFAKYGHGGLICAQLLAVVYFTLVAVVTRHWTLIFVGIGYGVLLALVQYTADKFLSAGDTLIKSSPSRLSSEAFLNCLALVAEALGIVVLIKAIAAWSLTQIIIAVGIWAVCDAIAYIALNPSLANIKIHKKTAAGEEAIGILSFVVKAVVRIVPFAFGVGAIVGSFALLTASLAILFKGADGIASTNPVHFVLVCACLPFASYILFTVYHLIIDVLRAILVIPGKLDKLTPRGE
jgi:hypothetical protein